MPRRTRSQSARDDAAIPHEDSDSPEAVTLPQESDDNDDNDEQDTHSDNDDDDNNENDEAESSANKENIIRIGRQDFQPPSSAATPVSKRDYSAPPSKAVRSSASIPAASASFLFSPPPRQPHTSAKRSGYADDQHWNAPPQASRTSQRESQDHSYSYKMQQTDPSDQSRRGMNPREGGRGAGGHTQRYPPVRHSSTVSYGGNIAADLDMAVSGGATRGDDDFGPTVADCLNLGSFAEESPPRKRSQQSQPRHQRSPRSSPPRHHPSSSYPPQPTYGGQYSYSRHVSPHHHPHVSAGPPPHHMYYQGGGPPSQSPYGYPPPQHGYPYRYPQSYAPPQPQDQWPTSPRAQYEYEDRPESSYPPEEHRSESNPLGSPPPKKRRSGEWDSSPTPSPEEDASTPEKPARQRSDEEGIAHPSSLMQSPFRSPNPTIDKSSSKKYKRSPLFQMGTPNIGLYGSFGMMDTPGGTLEEFSPMGPSFAPFESEPLGLGESGTDSGMQFDPKLSLNHSSSGEEGVTGDVAGSSRSRPVIRQRQPRDPSGSPFHSFMGELSPLQGSIRLQGSPVQHDTRDYSSSRYSASGRHPVSPRSQVQPSLPPLSSKRSNQPFPPRRHVMTSPLAPSHGSMSKHGQQSWYDPLGLPPGPVRLELGDVGAKAGETRKSFEGINSMLRGGSMPPAHHHTPSTQSGGYERRGQRPPSSYREDLSTPIKLDSSSTPAAGSRSALQSESRMAPYPSSTPSQQTFMSVAGPRYPPVARSSPVTTTSGRSPLDKENVSQSQRRNPCNCKKSKCLKLYCECFAAELYCEGCNCNDCQNTIDYEPSRSKAMKDTRAKNPNAFKPRIAVRVVTGPRGNSPSSGHNMGCRCKRSECLKKYCECFQAGVMCGSKCKCVDCLNYVGSQALIDKRRKIKDHRGADFAMRIADEAWKGKQVPGNPGGPRGHAPLPSPASHPRHPMHMMPHMMQPSPGHRQHGPPPPYMASMMMGHPHMGYSPMGMPPVTPGYMHGNPRMPSTGHRSEGRPSGPYGDPMQQRTPMISTPRTPAVRLGFDAHSSKKKRKLSPGSKEPTFPFFGDLPEQPKTTALAIFSFLSNDDLYNAGLVCKRWTRLSLDDELWQF